MTGAQRFVVSCCTIVLLAGLAVPAAQSQSIPDHPRDLVFEGLSFDPPDPAAHRHELSNGAVVYIVPDRALPLVSVSVLVRTGAYLEPDEKAGLAALTGSQMRSGGAGALAPAAFDEEAAFLAAELSSGIGDTSGRAGVNSLTKDLDASLDLLFDMLRRPRFDPDRLDLAKSQVLQRMERRNDSTQSIEAREWPRLLRGGEHFTTTPSTQASIDAITRDDLVAFHRQYYHPGNFIFAVSGDVEPADLLARLESRLAEWPAREPVSTPVPAPDHRIQPGVYVVDKDDVNQGRVVIGHLGTMRDNPDRYALMVMNDILGGGGFAARLLTRIRSGRRTGLQCLLVVRIRHLLSWRLPGELPVAQRDGGARGGYRAGRDRAHPVRAGDGSGASHVEGVVRRDVQAAASRAPPPRRACSRTMNTRDATRPISSPIGTGSAASAAMTCCAWRASTSIRNGSSCWWSATGRRSRPVIRTIRTSRWRDSPAAR